jgi:hypothetical protein
MKSPCIFRTAAAALFLFAGINSNIFASDSLITPSSSWKYLADGSNQNTAWKNTAFNDASWPSGSAEFGYGDGDEATVVSYGSNANNKYITTYFRKSFTVSNPSAYGSMLLALLRDDGAVVYINGTERYRTNMPTGAIGFKTRASTEITGAGETTYNTVSLLPSYFVAGTNVIAVELHQYIKTGPDVSFNLYLTASAATCGTPSGLNEQSISSSSAKLDWSALIGAVSYTVRYKDVLNAAWTTVATGNTFINLNTLPAAINFEWQVQAHCTADTGAFSASSFFSTLPINTTQTIISSGANWKYKDTGVDLGTGWRSVSYDDSQWLSGNAELGYGDGDEATVVSYGPNASNKYITTYFRKSFTVSNPSSYVSMILELVRDDGAVVYINGTEVYRNNMPSGSISYTTLASSAVADEAAWYTTTFSPSLLVSGTNVVAVEIHQVNLTSSDLSFNFKLSGTTIPSVIRGAYLQSATPSSIILRWRTDVATSSRVRFGTSASSYDFAAYDAASVTEHSIQLTGLSSATKYYYTVESGTTVLQGDSNNFFRTNPAAGTIEPVRIWAIGDFGNGSSGQWAVRDSYKNYTRAAL